MRGWYRILVTLVVLAAAFCMLSFACVCANLWAAKPESTRTDDTLYMDERRLPRRG